MKIHEERNFFERNDIYKIINRYKFIIMNFRDEEISFFYENKFFNLKI